MAINYLNSVDLNKNYINNAAIQNLASEPTPDTPGQVYFNTTSQVLKVTVQTGFVVGSETYAWEEVGGGVETLTTTDGIYINLTPNSATSGAVTVTADLSASGTKDSSTFLRGDNTWATPVDTNSTYDLATASTGTAITLSSNDASPDNVTISGTSNEIEVTRISGSELRVGLPNNVTISNNLTVANNLSVTVDAAITGNLQVDGEIVQTSSGGENQFASALNMGNNEIVDLADPTSPQEAATKAYVDAATVGGLIYQGGYNAATNTPDLDASPSASIKKGWTYTVTADGLFFTEQVRVGDVLIAESDTPTTLANWTTVQNNIDLASLTQVGIGNVNIDGAGNKDGLALAYASGTATVGLDINSLPNLSVDIAAADLNGLEIPLYNADTSDANEKIEIATLLSAASSQISYAKTITDTDTNIQHGLNTSDVMVQLYDVTTGETVYADVDRTSASVISVTFAATPTNSVRVLVQKIS
jgi:hypothetical protein